MFHKPLPLANTAHLSLGCTLYLQKTNVYDVVKREKLAITVSALKNIQVNHWIGLTDKPSPEITSLALDYSICNE